MTTEQWQHNTLLETITHNRAVEANQRYDTDMRYNASIYATDMNYIASKYSADMNYAATTYAANLNYRANVYATNQRLATESAKLRNQLTMQQNELKWKTEAGNADRRQSYINAKVSAESRKTSTLISSVGNIASGIVRLFAK